MRSPRGRAAFDMNDMVMLVSDIAIFVLKRDVKLQLTNMVMQLE